MGTLYRSAPSPSAKVLRHLVVDGCGTWLARGAKALGVPV